MATLRLAVQLYTVREACEGDFARTVGEVAGVGYTAVETAGYGSAKTAAVARRALDAAGLGVAGMHVPIEECESSFERVLDDAQTLGTRLVIVPWLDEDRRRSADDWLRVAAILSKFARSANGRGVDLAYHHHSFEFQTFDGRTAMDILFESASPAVKAELDVYWLAHAGQDPVAFIDRFGSRTVALHLKDMAAGPEQRYATVGEGVLDFDAISDAAGRAGVRYAAVEQDDCYGESPLDSLRRGIDNLRRLRIA